METNKIYCGDALKLIDNLDIEPNLIILSPPDIAETDFSLTEYKEFGITADKVPEKLANYTLDDPLSMTDYKEAFSDLSDINTNLEKLLEHINITENVNILMEKKLAERGNKSVSVLTEQDCIRCKLESDLH